MTLTIHDPETGRLAVQLAQLTGQSVEDEVKLALRQRLARVGGREDPQELINRVREIVRRSGSGEGLSSDDHATLLYDENGLPR